MSHHHDRPRIYINWAAVRPRTWRDWARAIAFFAFAIAALALIAIVASTLLITAAVVGACAAAYLYIANLFRRGGRSRRRDITPYQGDYDA